MFICLLNMGFILDNDVYVKPNTGLRVTIIDGQYSIYDNEQELHLSLEELEDYILDNYGDEL